METSSRKPLCPSLEKCSSKCCCMRGIPEVLCPSLEKFSNKCCCMHGTPEVFPIIIFIIITLKTNVIDSLTYILQFALITNEQIYNAFVIAVKTMINSIPFQLS